MAIIDSHDQLCPIDINTEHSNALETWHQADALVSPLLMTELKLILTSMSYIQDNWDDMAHS